MSLTDMTAQNRYKELNWTLVRSQPCAYAIFPLGAKLT